MNVGRWYDNIHSQLDATIIILLIISISSTCFGREFRPSSRALDCVYSLWCNAPTVLPAGNQDDVPPHTGHQPAAPSVLYTTSCKHSLVLLRMDEIVARNVSSWLKLLIKLLLLHLVGCLYYWVKQWVVVRQKFKILLYRGVRVRRWVYCYRIYDGY